MGFALLFTGRRRLSQIVVDTVMEAVNAGEFTVQDRDILAVLNPSWPDPRPTTRPKTRSQQTCGKTDGETIGVIFPILSRNRFICLRGIARRSEEGNLMLSYPADEVGNHLVDIDLLDEKESILTPTS